MPACCTASSRRITGRRQDRQMPEYQPRDLVPVSPPPTENPKPGKESNCTCVTER
jgi:hypothetical protein